MKIKEAVFLTSSTKTSQCPKPEKPEYAFIGRSNVGKSSLINFLTGRKKLAKTSTTPGKTITINHFEINDEWYLVDLPGYGYAKRSKTDRKNWEKMIRNYILTRSNLMNVFLLIDSRHKPQKSDLEFMEWLAISEIPFVLTFTKTDKLNRNKLESNLSFYKNELKQSWEVLPPIIVTSAHSGIGSETLLNYIDNTNQLF